MHLKIVTATQEHSYEVASWEAAVTECFAHEVFLDLKGLDATFDAFFYDDDGTVSKRVVNEDGSVYWEEL